MSEDEQASGPSLSHQALEAHEEFIQRVEKGQRMLRNLSIITLVVTVLLAGSYFSQLLEPFVTGQRYVQVDLLDPGLVVLELAILVLTLAWMYVGAVNYLFYSRMGRSIREIRALEKEMERKIVGA